MIDDTEKRMDELFDKLASNQISSSILAKLIHLCNALKANDVQSATRMSLDLMTTSFEKEGKWVLGLKRLVELYAKK
jgi:hypothetical protein